MKHLSYYISAILLTLFCTFALACKKTEEPAKPAGIRIEVNKTTTSSVTFTLIPENAVSMAYSFAPSDNTENAAFTELQGTEQQEITISDLEGNKEYTITANATNSDGVTCSNVTEKAVTTESASVKVELLSVTGNSVTFKISTVNAVSFSYAVVKPTEIENAELTEVNEAGPKEITETGLESGTVYSIIAYAYNADGEQSEMVLEPAKTEIMPEITVSNIETDENSATVTFECKNTLNLFYALTEKGAPAPEEKDFSSSTVTDKPFTAYFYELELGSEYTIWTYGTNKTGYKGELTSTDFIVEKGEEKDYKVSISNITQFDAEVNITWDQTKYPEAYWVVMSPNAIPDPSSFNWKEAIDNYAAQTVWGPGTYNLSSFMIQPGERYRIGVMFKSAEETTSDAYIWKDVDLKKVNIGESDCSIKIEHIMSAHSTITYKVINEKNAEYYYIGYTDSEDKVESSVLDVIKYGTKCYDFNMETSQGYLETEKEYYIIAVPVDAEGKFGNYTVLEASTTAIEITGDATLSCELTSASYCSLEYNVEFISGVTEAPYIVFKEGDYASDDEILKALASSYSKAYASGPINVTFLATGGQLTNNTSYNLWIAPLDKYGRLGQITKLTNSTKKITFDGTGNVAIRIDEFSNQEVGFKIKATLTPDSNVSGYLYKFTHSSSVDGFTDEAIVEGFYNGWTPEMTTGEIQTTGWDGTGESIYADTYLIILPFDQSGRMCPLIKYFIEDTASN